MNILENDKDLILELATLLFQDKITPAQSEVLETLLDKHEENRAYFDEIRNSWIATSLYHDNMGSANTEEIWHKISEKLDQLPESSEAGTIVRKRNLTVLKLARIAATWLLMVFLGGLVSWLILSKPLEKSNTAISEITTPLGSRSTIRLPDGSKVWLNAGSAIRYSQHSFRKNREVYLEGEAYFDVSKKPGNLFIVKTSDLNIKVYGTRFNVRSYPEENKIQTTLVEGSVAIEQKSKQDKESILFLKPNQTATFYKKAELKFAAEEHIETQQAAAEKIPAKNMVVIPEPDPVTKTSWKDERWVIVTKNFAELAIDMERRYNVHIYFKDEGLKDFKFSGTLANETFDQIMKIIQLSAPVSFEYTIEDNNVVLQYEEKK